MGTYSTGGKKPIKLKVSVQTEAHAMTYTGLIDPNDPDVVVPDIPPFNPVLKPGWKSLNKGGKVAGKIFRVVTFFRFFNSFPDEETFDLAIEQIKNTYEGELKGGNPPNHIMDFDTDSFYSNKTCVITSDTNLS